MWFNTSISGINAASTDLATISNNIANTATVGFKGSRAEFGDLYRFAGYGVPSDAYGSGVTTQRVSQQFTQGTLQSTNNVLDLAILGEGFFTLNDNGRTVYSRAGAFGTDSEGYVVNAQNQRLQVFPPVAGLDDTFNTGALADLQLTSTTNPPSATTTIECSVNLPANAEVPTVTPFDPDDPESYNESTSVTVYDSLGMSHTQTMYYVKEAATGTWTLHTTIDGTELGVGETLVFDDSGTLITPATATYTLPAYTPTNGAAPMTLTMDLTDTTMYGESFAATALTQDGYTSGELYGIEISLEGVVQARYTNGQVTPLGQLALASFANPQGLQQLGNTSWGETSDSGQPLRGIGGSNRFGTVQSGALEASNVDLTEALVNMMTAQRNFQANSQMISTTDQIMQTIVNLR